MPYDLWVEVVRALHKRLDATKSWTISNPDGTNLTAGVEALGLEGSPEGFSLRSFPIGVHKPLSTMKASGRIAVRWVLPSGVHTFDPPAFAFGEPVFLTLENGKVTNVEGGADAGRLKDHLKRVGEEIGKDGFIVNSWHGGINPLVDTPFSPEKGLWLWWMFAHNNPRFLHLHIVGEEVPGELALPILDPTVTFDGERIWDSGRLVFLDRDEVRGGAKKHSDPSRAFAYAEVRL